MGHRSHLGTCFWQDAGETELGLEREMQSGPLATSPAPCPPLWWGHHVGWWDSWGYPRGSITHGPLENQGKAAGLWGSQTTSARMWVCPAHVPPRKDGRPQRSQVSEPPLPLWSRVKPPLLPWQRRGSSPVSLATSAGLEQVGVRLHPRTDPAEKGWATWASPGRGRLGTEIYAQEGNEDEAVGSNQVQMKFTV